MRMGRPLLWCLTVGVATYALLFSGALWAADSGAVSSVPPDMGIPPLPSDMGDAPPPVDLKALEQLLKEPGVDSGKAPVAAAEVKPNADASLAVDVPPLPGADATKTDKKDAEKALDKAEVKAKAAAAPTLDDVPPLPGKEVGKVPPKAPEMPDLGDIPPLPGKEVAKPDQKVPPKAPEMPDLGDIPPLPSKEVAKPATEGKETKVKAAEAGVPSDAAKVAETKAPALSDDLPAIPGVGSDLPALEIPKPPEKPDEFEDLFNAPKGPPEIPAPEKAADKEPAKEAEPAKEKPQEKKVTKPKKAEVDSPPVVEDLPPVPEDDSGSMQPKMPKVRPQDMDRFKTVRMPDSVYKRSYDPLNKHLPKATYREDYYADFFEAVKRSDITAIHAFLNYGVPLTIQDGRGDTPLMAAIRHRNISVAQLLLARGANPNDVDEHGLSPLHVAALMNNRDFAELLIGRNASVGVMDQEGRTPLMIAANQGNAEMVRALLKAKADPNDSMPDGKTALHVAAARGQGEIVDMLLGAGARRETTDNHGFTAQYYAEYYRHGDLAARLAPPVIPMPTYKPSLSYAPAPLQPLQMVPQGGAYYPQQGGAYYAPPPMPNMPPGYLPPGTVPPVVR